MKAFVNPVLGDCQKSTLPYSSVIVLSFEKSNILIKVLTGECTLNVLGGGVFTNDSTRGPKSIVTLPPRVWRPGRPKVVELTSFSTYHL